jgi:hypothetical protein
MTKIGNLLFLCYLLILTTPIYSKIIVQGSVDQNYVIPGQTIRYTLIIESQNESSKINPQKVKFPIVKGLRVLTSYTSTSNSFTFVNGKTMSSKTLKIFYEIAVSSSAPLKIKIPPIKIIVKGKTYMTNPIELFLDKKKGQNRNNKGVAFLDVKISKDKLYLYEKLNITYYLYVKERYTISNLNLIDKGKLNNFFVHTRYDIFTINPSSIITTETTIGGSNYKAIKLFSYDISPKKSGEISIPVISIQGTVSANEMSFFDDPWNSDTRQFIPKRIVLSSPEINIEVKTLPVNNFGNFSGIVAPGLKASQNISKKEAKTGEGITYTIKLEGDFMQEIVKTPEIKGDDIFEIYDPEVKSSSNFLQYKYLIIPKIEGKFEFATPEIIYFDTLKSKFKKIVLPKISLSIKKGENYSLSSEKNNINGEEIKVSFGDIFFLKPVKEIKGNFSLVFFRWWYMGLLILSLVLPVFKIIREKKEKRYREDMSYRKKIRASRMAKKWKKQAEKHNGKDFYSFAYNFLINYFINKFYELDEDTTIDKLVEYIENKIKNQKMAEEIKEVFSEIEIHRFSPSEIDLKESIIRRIANIINYFE